LVPRQVNHKRSRSLVIMLLPILVLIGAIGWMLFTLGSTHKTTDKPVRKTQETKKQDNITFIPTIVEEEDKIINR